MKLGVMIGHTSQKNLLTFGGDPVPDTDSKSLFHFPHHCRIGDFTRFISIIQSPVDFCPTMLCKRGLCRHAVSVRLSVCVSVTFVHSIKTNKAIFEIFSPSGSQAILVFPYQTVWQYSDGASNAGGVGRKRDSKPVSAVTNGVFGVS